MAGPKYEPLFQPYLLNNGVELANRLVVAPTAEARSGARAMTGGEVREMVASFATAAGLAIDGGPDGGHGAGGGRRARGLRAGASACEWRCGTRRGCGPERGRESRGLGVVGRGPGGLGPAEV